MSTINDRIRESSRDFLRHVWPVINADGRWSMAEPVEIASPDSVSSQLDKKAGIDNWLVSRGTGLVFGMASRVQWPRNGSFDTFTVRVRSRCGRPAEYDRRRLEMVTPGAITPWWWCQAYIRCEQGRASGEHGDCAVESHHFIAAGVVQTRHLIKAVELEMGKPLPPNPDGSQGYQVKWERLLREGCKVSIWPDNHWLNQQLSIAA